MRVKILVNILKIIKILKSVFINANDVVWTLEYRMLNLKVLQYFIHVTYVKNMTYKISIQSVDCDVVAMSKRMVYIYSRETDLRFVHVITGCKR